MGSFDFTNEKARSLRYCRTHGFTAELFAATSRNGATADLWKDIARSWKALAEIKARAMESDDRAAKLAEELAMQARQESALRRFLRKSAKEDEQDWADTEKAGQQTTNPLV